MWKVSRRFFGVNAVEVDMDSTRERFTPTVPEMKHFCDLNELQQEIHAAIKPLLNAKRQAEHEAFQFEYEVSESEKRRYRSIVNVVNA
jgi:predicted RNase H-like nuclease